ncbi:MAG TPA: hypothetical protein PLI77_01645 [Bacteroidales bacterium]|nr:hypothetical protein [Bacteroidales bacterium]
MSIAAFIPATPATKTIAVFFTEISMSSNDSENDTLLIPARISLDAFTVAS